MSRDSDRQQSIDSEFDELLHSEKDEHKRRDAQLAVLLAHMRMANTHLAEYAVQQHLASRRLDAMEVNLTANTVITGEVREIMQTVQGGFRVLGWIGTGIKWMGGIAAAAVALYTAWNAFQNGTLPGGK